ncbi:MAG: hypothetical protein A2521_11770 [Deltaproteobacteria bacterium RIFOXYD12_FULL_57_12]|nr:MAG: hypothetical protein A2521_11770 [Deltaproteobacteria bacterium RIFOXYD12_FULL_57_12]
MKIADNTYVAIDYSLALDSGEIIDRSEGEPLGFITGADQIIPGLENALMGMVAGDSARITVEPEDGYGERQDELLMEVPRDQFPDDEEIEAGMVFETEGPHGPVTIVIDSVNANDTVTVNLNHPLAGQRLFFDVKVVEVRDPSVEELAALEETDGCDCGCEDGDDACGCGGDDKKPAGGCGCGCR